MAYRIWPVAFAGLAVLTSAPALAAGPSQAAHIARIEGDLEAPVQVRGRPVKKHTVAEELAAHKTPALSIAVVDHGRIVWARAYGLADVASGRKATIRTMFQAGSISKPVAASGAMKLIQAHRFSLDDTANSRLKSWQIPDNTFTKDHPVTLKALWTHTAGMTIHGFPGYAVGAPVPSVVQVLEGKPPANTGPVVVERTPGTFWNYSGGGITIGQLVMTDVTGQPFPQIMDKQVFKPVGMADSTYQQPPVSRAQTQIATGYLRSGQAVEGRYHTYPEMAAAGLWTTPTDLAKWSIALARAFNGEPSTLMSRTSARTMLTPGLGDWGIGIQIMGSGDDMRFTHGGDDWGFKANLVAWPKGERAIVGMANGDDGMAVVIELMQAVAREYGWSGWSPQIVDPVSLTPGQMADYAGGYGKGLAKVAIEGGALMVSYGGATVELIPVGEDRFLADNGGDTLPVRFTRGADGKISGVTALGLPTIPRDPAG